MRVSELCQLNIDDIDFYNKEATVYGKGGKERKIYLTPECCEHLKRYLKSRKDDNEALFVSLLSPHKRNAASGIEDEIRKLGRRAGVGRVFPHRFRRTLATNALNKGMSLPEVKEMLGHVKLDTTLIYN